MTGPISVGAGSGSRSPQAANMAERLASIKGGGLPVELAVTS